MVLVSSNPDCFFENRVVVDGEAFPNPLNPCEECKCASGAVDCGRTQCPRPHCNAPLPGTCCQNNCNGEKSLTVGCRQQTFKSRAWFPSPASGCSYAGKEYPNGHEFPHPTDMCRTCSCSVRTVPGGATGGDILVVWRHVTQWLDSLAEWQRPVSDEEVSAALLLQPQSGARELLPTVSW